MKKLRTRLVSAFLVIMTLLTLLPTSALAASGSGTGIKPTDNTNYWTTRLLHDGTPYSYKPPMAAGKLLYCLDRGYGYRWGTASFLNSYSYAPLEPPDGSISILHRRTCSTKHPELAFPSCAPTISIRTKEDQICPGLSAMEKAMWRLSATIR